MKYLTLIVLTLLFLVGCGGEGMNVLVLPSIGEIVAGDEVDGKYINLIKMTYGTADSINEVLVLGDGAESLQAAIDTSIEVPILSNTCPVTYYQILEAVKEKYDNSNLRELNMIVDNRSQVSAYAQAFITFEASSKEKVWLKEKAEEALATENLDIRDDIYWEIFYQVDDWEKSSDKFVIKIHRVAFLDLNEEEVSDVKYRQSFEGILSALDKTRRADYGNCVID